MTGNDIYWNRKSIWHLRKSGLTSTIDLILQGLIRSHTAHEIITRPSVIQLIAQSQYFIGTPLKSISRSTHASNTSSPLAMALQVWASTIIGYNIKSVKSVSRFARFWEEIRTATVRSALEVQILDFGRWTLLLKLNLCHRHSQHLSANCDACHMLRYRPMDGDSIIRSF